MVIEGNERRKSFVFDYNFLIYKQVIDFTFTVAFIINVIVWRM